jgi:hypothetical protein
MFQAVQESILALCRSFEFSFRGVLSESESSSSLDTEDTAAKLLVQWSDELRRKCWWKTCDCQWLSIPASALLVQPATAVDLPTSVKAWQLRICFEPEHANPQYVIRQYTYASIYTSNIAIATIMSIMLMMMMMMMTDQFLQRDCGVGQSFAGEDNRSHWWCSSRQGPSSTLSLVSYPYRYGGGRRPSHRGVRY